MSVVAPTTPAEQAFGVFDKYRAEAWPYKFEGALFVPVIAGGTPADEHVAEGWLRSKVSDTGDIIRSMVAQVMTETGKSVEDATAEVNMLQHLNCFKRDPEKGLYIEGRQLKAAIKEAASIAVASDKIKGRGWGKTHKGLLSFIAEHVIVWEDRLYLGRDEPSGTMQRFVHTWRGNGIQYEEFCEEVVIEFTVRSDWDFSDKDWAMIWSTGEQQGIGASRAQGFGRYTVIKWDKVPA